MIPQLFNYVAHFKELCRYRERREDLFFGATLNGQAFSRRNILLSDYEARLREMEMWVRVSSSVFRSAALFFLFHTLLGSRFLMQLTRLQGRPVELLVDVIDVIE